MSIDVLNLTHEYNSGTLLACQALREVTFSVSPGDWISVVGQTGSGKSTLVQHLNGLLFATSGSVQVDGTLLQEKSPLLREVRKKVGLVFQYPEQQLFAESVEQELAFAPRNWGASPEQIRSLALRALQAVGLDEALLTRSPFELSGGQKRRVAIASVLAAAPSYLVLDEPTAGLDRPAADELFALLRSLQSTGVGILHVTHDLEMALQSSDSLLLLRKEGAPFFGTPQYIANTLLENPVEGMALPPVLELVQQLRKKGIILPATWKIDCFISKLEAARKECNSQTI